MKEASWVEPGLGKHAWTLDAAHHPHEGCAAQEPQSEKSAQPLNAVPVVAGVPLPLPLPLPALPVVVITATGAHRPPLLGLHTSPAAQVPQLSKPHPFKRLPQFLAVALHVVSSTQRHFMPNPES